MQKEHTENIWEQQGLRNAYVDGSFLMGVAAIITSAAGTMTMAVIAAVAEFERDLLIECTHAAC